MEKSTLFIRGQIWYWEDPIYGNKENGKIVTIGENTLRYNRYVLIVQTTEMIDKSSIMVVPCSSKRASQCDVPINVRSLYTESPGYAKCKMLFPAHPRFLTRYVCTVPDEVMNNIDAVLIKNLLPGLCRKANELNKVFNIDVNKEITDDSKETGIYGTSEIIKSFIRNHLVNTGKFEDVITVYEMKEIFDTYCIKNNLIIDCDIVQFIEMFADISDISNIKHIHRSKYNDIQFRGIKVVGDLKISIVVNSSTENDSISPLDPQRPSSRWSEENKVRFMLIYNDRGPKAAAEVFKIKQSTAQQYYYKWKGDSDTPSAVKVMEQLPNTVDIAYSISSFVNKMNDFLRRNAIYTTYMKSSKEYISEDDFYKKMGSAIYYSLFSLLSIRRDKDTGEFYIPTLTSNSNFIETWRFFDDIYHDGRCNRCRNVDEIMVSYRGIRGKEEGINKHWTEVLEQKLGNMSKSHDIKSICTLIGFKVCSKNK